MVFGFECVPPTVTVNFVGGKCPLCHIMIEIDNVTTFVKVTKIMTSEKDHLCYLTFILPNTGGGSGSPVFGYKSFSSF